MREAISQRPDTPTATDATSSETILQFDIQEPLQTEQTEHRPKIVVETVRKLSSFGRHPMPRIDSTRRPFFMLTKSPKVVTQFHSSTSTLSEPTKQIIDTPTVYASDINPWKDYNSRLIQLPSFEGLDLEHSPETEEQYNLGNVYPTEDSIVNPSDSPHLDTPQPQFHDINVHHLTLPVTTLSIPLKSELQSAKSRSPKLLVRKHRSMLTGKKKGIQWKHFVRSVKRRPTPDVPAVEKQLFYTRSSPNLKLGESSQELKKDTSDDDTNTLHKET